MAAVRSNVVARRRPPWVSALASLGQIEKVRRRWVRPIIRRRHQFSVGVIMILPAAHSCLGVHGAHGAAALVVSGLAEPSYQSPATSAHDLLRSVVMPLL